MGGRGSSSGMGNSAAKSSRIRDEFISKGMNSKFKGVRRDAQEGKGNYSYKNSKAVGDGDLDRIQDARLHEYNGNTLIEGRIGQKGVVYGNKSDSTQIKHFKKKMEKKKEQRRKEEEENRKNRPEIRTTSTYDRWKKQNDKNFEAWFGKR